MRPIFCLTAALLIGSTGHSDDIIIADFESGDYSGWTIRGEAFAQAPARGTLPNQQNVSGYRGEFLVNTFFGGDDPVGTAVSNPFPIERPFLAFLIGGGNRPELSLDLLLDDHVVRTATGSDSEDLLWEHWDVRELQGRQCRLRIRDEASGGWGHINVDRIVMTDHPPERFDVEFRAAEYRKSPDFMNERYRPQFHFTPLIYWMNDPNGLVHYDGEYHLFHQYNPAGNEWGHMSWGHAVSRDLFRWEHLPTAIPEADGVMAFSGCCVTDHGNTSGFATGDQPPLVAVYTGHGFGKQVQNLAYSNDRGRTWIQYDGNPVLDIGNPDFRDPKVFRHEETDRWVMVVSLAAEKVLVFYGSDDLKNWTELSRFGPAGATEKPNWECPDLFELPVENEPGTKLWVLEADMGGGSVAGGSGGEYFVGHFDGTEFTTIQEARWVDYGRDFYAPVSWSDIPEDDGRRIWIGWFNNWETCLVPTSPWRSCMSVPRELTLRRVTADDGAAQYVLIQRPARELKSLELRQHAVRPDTSEASWPPAAMTQTADLPDLAFRLQAVIRPGSARSAGFRIRTGPDEFTEFGYDSRPGVVYADRRQSGNTDFHPAFAGRHEAPVGLTDGRIRLDVLVDRSMLEIFANDGEVVISDQFFPLGSERILECFAGDSSATIEDVVVTPIRSVWHDIPTENNQSDSSDR